MGTAFTFLARSAIARIPRKEAEKNRKALALILDLYQMGTKSLPEQKALVQLHQHVDLTAFGVDEKELVSMKEYVERMTGLLPEMDDRPAAATASALTAATDQDDAGDDNGEDDLVRVFPPGLEKASDVPGVSNAWGFRCDLCGHICIQTRHLYAHFKEGRGAERLRMFRAIQSELVWWAKDGEGNEYTGELLPLTGKLDQPPIPAPCGDRMRAANVERVRRRRETATAKRTAAAEERRLAGTKRKRDDADAEEEAEEEAQDELEEGVETY